MISVHCRILLPQDSSSDVTVTSLDSNDSGCISPAELLLVEPPEICLRPVLPVATAPDAVTSSSDETAAFESGNSMELLYRRHDIEQLQSPLTCISSSKCDTAGGSDDVEVTQTSHNHVDKWRNRLEKRNIVRRVLLLTASVIDGKDDVAAIFLLAIITILFLYVTFCLNPSVLIYLFID